ncbi:MAG TPA: hypothetical protein VK867_06405 [Candidatus Limnocylindrales bacterium]|nr:hypothetical protein [Candidatus Limnocylindrales bacterium]
MTDSDSVRRFPIGLGRRSRPLLRLLFGATPENAHVDLGEELDAHFGFGSLRTPAANIVRWRIEGPWLWITAIGIRRGIRDGVFSFAGTRRGGVRLDFRDRVPTMRIFRTPALYVAVEDLEGFAAALSERGIAGEDARRR